jgi:hypothetical protein
MEVFVERGKAALDFRTLPVEGFDFIVVGTVLTDVTKEAGLWEDAGVGEDGPKQLPAGSDEGLTCHLFGFTGRFANDGQPTPLRVWNGRE